MSDTPQSSWSSDSVRDFSDLPIDVEKERAFKQRQKESLAAIDAVIEPLVKEHENAPEVELEDKRPFLDVVRDQLPGISLAQRERWQRENYEARRARALGTSEKKPTQAEVAAAEAEVARINAYFEREHEAESWDDDEGYED